MNIAICISGNLRKLNLELINSLVEKLSENTPEKNVVKNRVDVFMSTWDDKGYWTKDDEKGLSLGNSLSSDDLNEIKQIKNLRVLDIEKLDMNIQEKFKDEYLTIMRNEPEIRLRFGRPQNILGMYYKIWRCNNLKLKYSMDTTGGGGVKYDLTFRMRPDYYANGKVTIDNKERTLKISKQKNGLYSDTFFYGPNEYMDKICRMYLHLGKIYRINTGGDRCLFDPHDLLKNALKYYNIPVDTSNFIESCVLNTPNGYCVE